MTERIAIETPLGIIDGRDAIYLERIEHDYPGKSVKFYGNVNGSFCSKGVKDTFKRYVLTFGGLHSFRMTDLDKAVESPYMNSIVSNFCEIIDHAKNKKNPRAKENSLKHFIIKTYDDVFDIVCRDYEFNVEN